MDEQRIQDYLNLIQQLLDCPNGQEGEILQANSGLIDEGLIAVMEQVAEDMTEDGNCDVAEWLQNLAVELIEPIGELGGQRLQKYLSLIELLLSSDNEEKSEVLQANQSLIDEGLVGVMEQMAVDLAESGEQDAANKLQNLATQLINSIREKPWYKLNQRVVELYESGKYTQAGILARQALELARSSYGNEHPDVFTSLNNLAVFYQAQGRYKEAEGFYEEALKLSQYLLGDENAIVAKSLNNLGSLCHAQGRYREAEALLEQALNMRQCFLGNEDPDVAESLNNLASLYQVQGRYREAESLLQESLEITQRLVGNEHSDVAVSLINLAEIYREQGRYREAKTLLQQALNLLRHQFGHEHPDVATSLNNLGLVCQSEGLYSEAESFLEQALDLRRHLWGNEHDDVADSLNNLALLRQTQGRYSEAEPLYQQALGITQQLFGDEHPDIAQSLNNLALLYREQGRYQEAENLYKGALNLRINLFGDEHPDIAQSLNNLALLYRAQGRYQEAEPLLQEALKLWRNQLGEEHPTLADCMNNLAVLYDNQRNYHKAAPLYKQALALWENRFGNENPFLASGLHNLASHYADQECYSEAKQLLEKALDMTRRLEGNEHPHVAQSLNNLAVVLAATGYPNEALLQRIQANEIDTKVIRTVFAFSSENDRLAYLQKIRGKLDGFISLIYSHLLNSPHALQALLDLILKRKALTASALAAQNEALYSDRYPHLTEDFHKLRDLSEQIIHLTFSTPQTEDFTTYQQQLVQLQAEHNNLQKTLASQVPEIQLQEQLPNRSDVAAELPAGSILIEFIRFDLFNFKAIPAKGEAQWQPARYLAFILPAGQPESVEMVDIGEAECIDSLIREFRELVSGAGKNQESQLGMFSKRPPKLIFREYHPQVGIKLRQAIFDKLRPALKEHKHLIIAPDGELNLVPFQIIPSDDTGEKMLMDEFTISYLTVGRDILRQKIETKRPASINALVFASPNFDLSAESVTSDAAPKQNIQTENLRECIANKPLKDAKGTNILGERVAQKLKVASYLGSEALESYFKPLQCPRILLIATHGVFLPNQPEDPSLTVSYQRESSLLQRDRFFGRVENPMLRSALALAGANTWAKGGKLPPQAGKGILFAQDIAGLDLWANEITVLSACETAIGDVAIGEGVFGFRRAFAVAGTKTLIMSLWSVNGWTTALLMERFFDNCESGLGRADALQEAQNYLRNITVRELQQFELGQEILKQEFNNGRELDATMLTRQAEDKPLAHPYYWGAWICQGDTKPI
ncbi:CHAT domain-containing protein [Limnofasciculus baicalensis]|uniref:CHAT domain-containing protein n=1 Tax=Limnofasciculus baicalensis BBK-W-15 TaxID=2699891 RepID=A0AAE3GNI0_9CYAN|nr:CHAT domain-containing tetratricopeptide repeat protein [Limnofasciculus baicalensis]MCP2727639.1 CHAT domain-containing protein [Limnofasciculus baicalensis BBK-W-15]